MSITFSPNAIAAIAALIGDPARANMLLALMGGQALTAGELASAASISPQTASGHLAKLCEEHLLSVEKQGRHRYFRLASHEVAQVMESLMSLTAQDQTRTVRTGPKEQALRQARVCYDHLAGQLGVALAERLGALGHLEWQDGTALITDKGKRFFCDFGLSLDTTSRRPLCRTCLDWSERRPHLAGQLGAALLQRLFDLHWLERRPASRALIVTDKGLKGLHETFAIALSENREFLGRSDKRHWPIAMAQD